MIERFGLLVVALTLATAAAARELELLESAYEARLENVTLPGNVAGTAQFRLCDGCDSISMRVTPSTRYLVGGTELSLADFRTAAAAFDAQHTGVGIYADASSRLITRISIHVSQR